MAMPRPNGRLNVPDKLALVCIFFGWFLLSTVVVSLGALQHSVRFFDLGAVIADPARLFYGVDSVSKRIAFGAVCFAALCAPFWPSVDGRRQAWLGYMAPLLLMLVCGVVLYVKTSGEMFADPARADSVAHTVIRFANVMARHGGSLVARHITVGAGAYLSLLGSVFLSVRGARGYAGQRADH